MVFFWLAVSRLVGVFEALTKLLRMDASDQTPDLDQLDQQVIDTVRRFTADLPSGPDGPGGALLVPHSDETDAVAGTTLSQRIVSYGLFLLNLYATTPATRDAFTTTQVPAWTTAGRRAARVLLSDVRFGVGPGQDAALLSAQLGDDTLLAVLLALAGVERNYAAQQGVPPDQAIEALRFTPEQIVAMSHKLFRVQGHPVTDAATVDQRAEAWEQAIVSFVSWLSNDPVALEQAGQVSQLEQLSVVATFERQLGHDLLLPWGCESVIDRVFALAYQAELRGDPAALAHYQRDLREFSYWVRFRIDWSIDEEEVSAWQLVNQTLMDTQKRLDPWDRFCLEITEADERLPPSVRLAALESLPLAEQLPRPQGQDDRSRIDALQQLVASRVNDWLVEVRPSDAAVSQLLQRGLFRRLLAALSPDETPLADDDLTPLIAALVDARAEELLADKLVMPTEIGLVVPPGLRAGVVQGIMAAKPIWSEVLHSWTFDQ
ncbi:MAG: hypothetical protein LBV30_10025 [Propionibacteriaceae bacterium]|jgi:hypothetical protein|nr:hypothetical protein [Propionibacteriaceae bacterium]